MSDRVEPYHPSMGEPVMRCCGCSYDLAHLPDPRCPECGREFDPTDPRSYLSKPINGKRWLIISVIAFCGAASGPLLAWFSDLGWVPIGVPIDAGVIVAFHGGWITSFVVASRVGTLLRRGPAWVEHPLALRGAFALAMIVVAAFVVFVVGGLFIRLI